MESLDPRIQRLDKVKELPEKDPLDQLITYEVFVQQKEGKAFRHEGIVHASDEELAFIFAKEQFSRRQMCAGLWIVATRNVYVSHFTDNQENIYSHFGGESSGGDEYEVFHLLKRGKQHVHAGAVRAESIEQAFTAAARQFGETMAYNIWVTRVDQVLKSKEEDKDIWETLPEKKFREALAYRAGDKLKDFLDKNRHE